MAQPQKLVSFPLIAALLLFLNTAFADDYQDATRLLKEGRHSAALAKVDAALAANPKDARARFLKGLILTEDNKPQEAIKVFTALTEDYPELPEPYNNLAVLYAAGGQYDQARKSLEMAIRTHPSYAIAHENLGDVYAKMASEAYDKALQLDRSNKTAKTKLSLIRELFPASAAAPSARPATAPAAQTPAEPATPKTPASGQEPAVASKTDPETEVIAAVNKWAEAWARKDVKAYLSHYSPSFDPGGGESREAWAATRQDRLTRPKFIEVKVSAPEVTFDASGMANVKFRQSYRSDTFSTAGTKTLTMAKSAGGWLIVKEQIDR